MTAVAESGAAIGSAPRLNKKPGRSWLSSLGFGENSVDRASYYLLRHHRTDLEVRLLSIDESRLGSDLQRKNYQVVSAILKAPLPLRVSAPGDEWDEIYKAESLITTLLDGAKLRGEIRARLEELARNDRETAQRLKVDYEELLTSAADELSVSGDTILHSFLLRVMEAIHWVAKRKNIAQPLRKEATKTTYFSVLVAFMLLLAPYLLLNIGDKALGKWWSLFPLYNALAAGLCGACFSRAMTLRQRWSEMTLDEVFLHREWSYALLRAGIGVSGALIVFYFLSSELISGPLFPAFDSLSLNFATITRADAISISYLKPSKDLALLTFWCFLAGFSEALVPSILASTERQMIQTGNVSLKAAN